MILFVCMRYKILFKIPFTGGNILIVFLFSILRKLIGCVNIGKFVILSHIKQLFFWRANHIDLKCQLMTATVQTTYFDPTVSIINSWKHFKCRHTFLVYTTQYKDTSVSIKAQGVHLSGIEVQRSHH